MSRQGEVVDCLTTWGFGIKIDLIKTIPQFPLPDFSKYLFLNIIHRKKAKTATKIKISNVMCY